jgi:hypothetical protein
MTAEELTALEQIQGYARANRIRLEWHAKQRMRLRNAQFRDVQQALLTATNCRDQRADPSRVGDWLVMGVDCGGDELSCSVLLEGEALICTLF